MEKAGFRVVRQGKHVTMTNGERIWIIPWANPINAFTMAEIVKDAGLTIEEFKNKFKDYFDRLQTHEKSRYSF